MSNTNLFSDSRCYITFKSIMLYCPTSKFSQICNMNTIGKNTKKVRKTTKSATKGAIFLVYPKSTFSSDPSIVRKAANNSDVLISNMRKVMAGGTNSNLDTYEKCAEALEKRLLIIEIPDTTELNIILTKDGSKIDNLWKFPYTKDYHTLMDFLLTIFGNDEIPQPFDEEMFKLVATLSAAANKKGMENEELLTKIRKFRKDIVKWATSNDDSL